ncbi:MAG: hypothetical protein K2Y56_08320 [Methylobacterium sp.]|uniref:hypothetical protein n=1 Tax=Methylobacterium sp. TaxID=409 RepID=UPI0025F32AC5|nr:hypothetical protein [Methylobacterium sp.]MBX9931531.1 hypothetical protein [Methylobacterium sp.]
MSSTHGIGATDDFAVAIDRNTAVARDDRSPVRKRSQKVVLDSNHCFQEPVSAKPDQLTSLSIDRI